MLDPKQFAVNDAWIAFRLNSVPIRTERDGDFNCIALMDAASGYMLGSELVPTTSAESSSIHCRRLLKSGQGHSQQLPGTLFVTTGEVADLFTHEANRKKIDVVPVAEEELLIFIGEARQTFAQRFEMVPGAKAS